MRWTSSLNRAAAATQNVVEVRFIDLDIQDDHLYLNNSNLTLAWGGQTWSGLGVAGAITGVKESTDAVAYPVRLALSGVETNLITDAMAAKYKDRPVTIYCGLLDPDTLALIDTPQEEWSGFMDVMTIEAEKGGASIELTCEHWLRIAPTMSRYTDEDQKALHPGDRFFSHTHQIKDYIGKWGARDISYGAPAIGDGPGPRRRSQEF